SFVNISGNEGKAFVPAHIANTRCLRSLPTTDIQSKIFEAVPNFIKHSVFDKNLQVSFPLCRIVVRIGVFCGDSAHI
ncbi:MAG: hypothetical protein AAB769_01450, partial [Patescibacteria group bacterium]